MSRFLVNNFFTYCLNFEGNPSNLHLCIFQKAEIAQAALASAISAFWKTHKCKLIIISNWTRKTVWLLINNTKTKKFCTQKSAGRCFSHSRKLFSEFPYKIFVIALHEWDHWPTKFLIVFLQIIIQNYYCVICTGVTLKLHSSQPVRIE